MDDEIVMNTYGVLAEITDYKTIEAMGLHKLSNKGNIMEAENYLIPKNNNKNHKLSTLKLDDLKII